MTATSPAAPLGRRERNKQQKLDRITAAATELFSRYGVDEVTTQQIADAADIGTGTLFLYAKSKAELLLLVQNAHYAEAIEVGAREASTADTPLDAVMAMVRPVVECNRRHVENGRSYLRELVFGDPEEPFHRAGLELIQQVDDAFVEIVTHDGRMSRADAVLLARVISAAMFISLASPFHLTSSDADVCEDIRSQVSVILRG